MDKINYPKQLSAELTAEELAEYYDGAPTPEEYCADYTEHEDTHFEDAGKWVWYCQQCEDYWAQQENYWR